MFMHYISVYLVLLPVQYIIQKKKAQNKIECLFCAFYITFLCYAEIAFPVYS